VKKIKPQLCAAVSKAVCQNGSEVYSVYGRYGTGPKYEIPIPKIPLLNWLVKLSYCFHLTHLPISGSDLNKRKSNFNQVWIMHFKVKSHDQTEFSLGLSG
jgi:hypothetical protein